MCLCLVDLEMLPCCACLLPFFGSVFVLCFSASGWFFFEMAFVVESDSFHLYLSSDGCLDRYPENKPSDFRILLKNPKELNNKNRTWKVGLSRLGYDSSALYNLGKNTNTFMHVYSDLQYYKIEMESVFAGKPENAVSALMSALKEKHLDSKVIFGQMPDDPWKITLGVKDVDDIGFSPMLRKLLGFHKDENLFSENFEFRKLCRDFVCEASGVDPFAKHIEDHSMIPLYRKGFFKGFKNFNQRDDLFSEWKMDIPYLYSRYEGAPMIKRLQEIVSRGESEYHRFFAENYSHEKPEVLETHFDFHDKDGEKVSVSMLIVTYHEFCIHTVLAGSLFAKKERRNFISDTKFNPHLFTSLYVYSNIVKPVDFNDRQFKLLDIIFLKPHSEFESSVVEHKSTHFKILDVDIVSEIRISIKTALGLPAPFIHGPVFAVLEFQDFRHG